VFSNFSLSPLIAGFSISIHSRKAISMENCILRLPKVKVFSGKSRATIYREVKLGLFPAPISLGARAVGWLASDLEAWLAGRIAESRDAATPVSAAVAHSVR
jgi:prophage regulatory protein